MKISLTIGQRVKAIAILNDWKGKIEDMRVILDDANAIRISDEEWNKAERKINKVKNERGEEVENWSWDDEKGGKKDFELDKTTINYLKKSIDDKNDKGEFSLADIAIAELRKNLK